MPSPLKPLAGARHVRILGTIALVLAVALAVADGCASYSTDATTALLGPFNNSTDPTNGGASYIGSAACSACHSDVAELTRVHGHSQALKASNGLPPEYPPEGTRAGVPNPPAGRTYNDIGYIIGGYTKGAFFVGADGFVLTTGVTGVNTQWNLDFPPNGTTAGFVAFKASQTAPEPYRFECFRCHVVGAQPQDPAVSQDGRPGILGTWAEPGVKCEACHGPGSNHAPDPWARQMFVDSTNRTCGNCHVDGNDSNVIAAANGYISPMTQVAELLASGGHSGFACGVCHDVHASTTYDPARGIRNQCTACHPDQNLAFHTGFVLTRGSYSEPLGCTSCHMTYAGLQNSVGGPAAVGTLGGRMGDVRSHIFRIDTAHATFDQMFSADGSHVLKDSAGRAAVTPDFVCLRCHNGEGSAFIISAQGAATIADGIHDREATGKPAIPDSMNLSTPP